MSFLFKSGAEVNTPRAMTSRSIFENPWLSQQDWVGVKCI
jgi:hypothetical protein